MHGRLVAGPQPACFTGQSNELTPNTMHISDEFIESGQNRFSNTDAHVRSNIHNESSMWVKIQRKFF